MISTFYPPYNFGGDGIFVYRLCNELAQRGHKIDVVHCIDSFNLLGKNNSQGDYPNHQNITVYPLKSHVNFLSPFLTQQTSHSYFKRKKIKELILKNKYDVIHYHNMSLIGLETLTFGNAIKFYTMHDHWLVCPMHILWKHNREVCTQRSCMSCQIFGKRPIQWWRYTHYRTRKLSHLDTLISPSLFTKRKHHEFGINMPIEHLPYFLSKSVSHSSLPDETGFDYRKPFFLFVGRLEKIKGVQNLIPVFRAYNKCDLRVVGIGKYASTLKDLAQDVPNIKFLGRVAYHELELLYRNAIALIVPSICYEVFAIILIEAFSQKTPVIVNNSGALPEIVQQSEGGFIYNTDQELIQCLEQLRLNQQLRNELGNKGYQAYQKYWTEEYHVPRYYQLIQESAHKKNIKNFPV